MDAVGFLPKRSHMDVCISRGFDAAALAFGGIIMGLDFLFCCAPATTERRHMAAGRVASRLDSSTPPRIHSASLLPAFDQSRPPQLIRSNQSWIVVVAPILGRPPFKREGMV